MTMLRIRARDLLTEDQLIAVRLRSRSSGHASLASLS